jgi:sporulation protein YlmC with PRC-barrel domain
VSAAQLRLELLVGRKVTDATGQHVGRIEEIVAETGDGECRVLEYHVGSLALLESLGGRLGSSLLRLAWPGSHRGYVVPWEMMDLRDPDHPRITCNRAALRPL